MLLQNAAKSIVRDGDIGKDLHIGTPTNDGAVLFLALFDGSAFQLALRLSFSKGDAVYVGSVIGGNVHKLGGILRCTRTEAVETERILVCSVLVVVRILTAGIQLAEYQLPVVAFFLFVIAERHAATEVLYLNGMIAPNGNDDLLAVSLTRLVD